MGDKPTAIFVEKPIGVLAGDGEAEWVSFASVYAVDKWWSRSFARAEKYLFRGVDFDGQFEVVCNLEALARGFDSL